MWGFLRFIFRFDSSLEGFKEFKRYYICDYYFILKDINE